jgi:hypothetical protein
MKFKILQTVDSCDRTPYTKGQLLLVNTDYAWDNAKVEVIAVLQRGCSPEMSAYKSSLRNVTDEEVIAYITDRTFEVPE